jgi:hypothetical protein
MALRRPRVRIPLGPLFFFKSIMKCDGKSSRSSTSDLGVRGVSPEGAQWSACLLRSNSLACVVRGSLTASFLDEFSSHETVTPVIAEKWLALDLPLWDRFKQAGWYRGEFLRPCDGGFLF